jgi:DmsE family decaheme c-type cytochrome
MPGPSGKFRAIVWARLALVLVILLVPLPGPAQQPAPPAQPPAAPPGTPGAPATPAAPLIPPGMPAGYVGADICKLCHDEQYRKFEATKMGRLFLKHPRNMVERLGCENCHGPGQKHFEAGGGKSVGGMITFAKNDPTPVVERNAKCVACHNRGPHLFWKGSAHESRDVACTSCHRLMEHTGHAQLAKGNELETCGTCHLEKRAAQMRSSHMPLREGKMKCTSCHNPHGTVTPALLKEPSLNDTCFTCHAEKRGPFLWVHAPVNESCSNCHDPHGSNHQAMLKTPKPRLCQQCHIETRHPTNPYSLSTPNFKFLLGRGCSNCHVNIHGSNHPAGFAFTR